jgi:hypothetical protein
MSRRNEASEAGCASTAGRVTGLTSAQVSWIGLLTGVNRRLAANPETRAAAYRKTALGFLVTARVETGASQSRCLYVRIAARTCPAR